LNNALPQMHQIWSEKLQVIMPGSGANTLSSLSAVKDLCILVVILSDETFAPRSVSSRRTSALRTVALIAT